jgi:secondary thiamine-phosphate synthase enzyme
MVSNINVKTTNQTQMIDITNDIQRLVSNVGMESGICCIYVPHTTAGVTINEGADPSVRRDILYELNKIIPFQDGYQHGEGNSAAHIKSSIIGVSLDVIVDQGRLLLGTWQAIYFCEFDGPRHRKLHVKLLADN